MSFTKTLNKIWYLFTSEQRISAIILFFLLFIGMLLETLGIGLVIPAFTLITQSNLAEKYPIVLPLLKILGNPSYERLVVIGMLTFVGVYVIKTLYLAFLAWRQAKFTFDIRANLSERLFSGYLLQPYTFHLQRNSAQLIRNTIGHTASLTAVIQQCLLLLMEVLVLFGVSTMLFMVEPLGAILVLGVMGFTAWAFNNVTRKHILKWGEESQFHEGLRIQHLQQGLGGAKDVKLLGRERNFIDRYNFHNIGSAKANQRQSILVALPRPMLELFAVMGLALLVTVMISQGRPIESLIPITGLFAAAAFRLLPSVNRVISAVQTLRFSLPVINTLYDEISLLGNTKQITNNGVFVLKDKLTLEQVRYNYPSTKSSALSEINLTINQGKSFGFIGDSGAGKSTLVDIILGLLTPISGAVKVDGVDIQENVRGWQDQIGYVPQTIYLTDDTLRQNIAFGLPSDQIDDTVVWRTIRDAQLENFVNSLPNGINTMVGERGIRLSGGQRQRIGIARSLYHDPSVLVLDEATSSLDMDTERSVMEAVRDLRGKKTILIVAHRLSTVEDCDYLYRLQQGKIISEGSVENMLYEPKSIKEH